MLQKDSEISLPEAVYNRYAYHPTDGSVTGWITLANKGVNEIEYYFMENLNNANLSNKRDRFDIAELIAEARLRATLELKIGPAIDIEHSLAHQFVSKTYKGVGIFLFGAADVKAFALKYPSFHSYESFPNDIIATSGGLLEAIHRLDIIFELRKRYNWRFNEEFQKALDNIPKPS